MKFIFTNQDKEYEVEISEVQSQTKITVNGKDFLFGKDKISAVEIAVAQANMPRRDFNAKEVRAVLAGTITEISVKIDDIVKPGQKLLTLSAMKMENEILAECDGKVKEIKIAKDQKVKEGDVLIVLA